MSDKKRVGIAIPCPSCWSGHSTSVIDARGEPDKYQILRVRKCKACGTCFDTYERIADPANIRFRK